MLHSEEVNSGETDPNNTAVKLRPGIGMDVELRDAHGNKRVKTQKDKVTAEVRPLTVRTVKASRNEDGSFAVKWPGTFSGDYEANVLVNGHAAPGGPFKNTVNQAPVSDAHKQALQASVPKVAGLLERLLVNATPAERERIVAALSGGEPEDSSSSSSDSD